MPYNRNHNDRTTLSNRLSYSNYAFSYGIGTIFFISGFPIMPYPLPCE